MKQIALICLLLLININAVNAQTISYKCDYPTYSDEKGNHKVSEKFELHFILDVQAGKAYMTGNLGSTEVAMVSKAELYLRFREKGEKYYRQSWQTPP